MKKNTGIISLTVVIFMMVIMVLVLALLQSRILLGIQRTKGTADTILSTYNAESHIYDTLARFQKGYDIDATEPTQTLPDGTQLTYETVTTGGEQEITVTAKLPFATTKLRMSRGVTTTSSFHGVDLILSLDCTGSMRECADPQVAIDRNDQNWCANPLHSETTRFQELQRGTLAFLNGLNSISEVPIRVGISVFSGDSDWALTANTVSPAGVPLRPDNDISIADAIETIERNFTGKQPSSSIGCSVIPEEGTSHASSLQFMHKHFMANKVSTIKQVEVMVTDGEPTTTIPSDACGTDYFIPAGNFGTQLGRCPVFNPILDPAQVWNCYQNPDGSYAAGGQIGTATQLATCMVTNNTRTWNGSAFGQRDPDVDAYIIATYKLPDSAPFKQVMTTEPGVFYYDTDNAEDLTEILQDDVIDSITQTINEFRIQRVID